MTSGSPDASDTFSSGVCRARRPSMIAFSESDFWDSRLLPWARSWMKSRVASGRSWRSLRLTPTSTPWVKTLWPPTCPNAPVGAKVTADDPGNSRQLFGTLMRNRSPSVYSRYRDEGGCTGPSVPLGLEPPSWSSLVRRLAVFAASSDVGARGNDFRWALTWSNPARSDTGFDTLRDSASFSMYSDRFPGFGWSESHSGPFEPPCFSIVRNMLAMSLGS